MPRKMKARRAKGQAEGLEVEVTLEVRGPRTRMGQGIQSPSAPRTPRVARLLALAIKLQDMVDRSEVRDYADLAQLGYVTRARMTQIMNLLLLAPDIQEQILFERNDPMPERDWRRVAALTSWPDQRTLLQIIKKTRTRAA